MKARILVVLIALLLPTTFLKAQPQSLPQECFSDTFVDLRTCPLMPWEIPLKELEQGYYGVNGILVPGIPDESLNNYVPGYHLVGSATYMRRGVMPGIVQEKADKWGIDPSPFVGGVATDSCGYVGASAWVRKIGTSEWVGPLLVVDCTAFIHKYERACLLDAVVELGYETFSLFQSRGRLNEIEVVVKATTDLSPPGNPGGQPIHYASSWLHEANLPCVK